ncbi:MAG TPA: class I SAM-dependent methyltransferase [Flavisolibacter sp.]|nr:class I SAM-dependent methyltransferase [Flavisolibacter sp.]
MEQPFGKFLMFQNRLEKVYRHIAKQARRQGITCYRIYDHDLPEFPLMVEVYDDKLYVAEYKRQHQLTEEAYEEWWQGSKAVLTAITGVVEQNIFQKVRKRKESRLDQYQKNAGARKEFEVHENGLKFIINLSDYLDTGLFLDHRLTRGMVRDESKGKRVLNLFCYTGSFSVYAVAGGASKVTSVDLSKTYLAWAERNVQLNFEQTSVHETVHADVLQYLKDLPAESYDLIIMDPPTFSNSKRMDDILDIQRDHVALINDCLRALAPEGVLYFSTNYRKFFLESSLLHTTRAKDITRATTPFDFAGKLHRQCFKIVK